MMQECGSGSGTGTGSAPATEPVNNLCHATQLAFEVWYDRWRRTVLTKEEHEAAQRAKQ